MIKEWNELKDADFLLDEHRISLQRKQYALCIIEDLDTGLLRVTHAARFPQGVYTYDPNIHDFLCNPLERLVDEVMYQLAPAKTTLGFHIRRDTETKPWTRYAKALGFIRDNRSLAAQFYIRPSDLRKVKCEMPF